MLSLAFAGPVPTETGKIALSFTHAIHVVSSWGVLFWSCGPCLLDMGRFEFVMGRFAASPGGAASPLLSNIYLHWIETIAGLAAKAMGQAMTIVRYADDFVLLAKSWREGFLRKVESILEERMARFLNRKSQWRYRLKFADSYYGEMAHYGLYRLATARTRI